MNPHSSKQERKTKVSNTGAKAGTAAARWQQEFKEKIKHKIRRLQEEFEEVSFIRHVADEVRDLRKKLLTESCD